MSPLKIVEVETQQFIFVHPHAPTHANYVELSARAVENHGSIHGVFRNSKKARLLEIQNKIDLFFLCKFFPSVPTWWTNLAGVTSRPLCRCPKNWWRFGFRRGQNLPNTEINDTHVHVTDMKSYIINRPAFFFVMPDDLVPFRRKVNIQETVFVMW